MGISITSTKTLAILTFLLENRTVSQYSASKDLGISIGLVNRTFQHLLEKGIMARQGRQYALIKPHLLSQIIAFHISVKKASEFYVKEDTILKGTHCLSSVTKDESNTHFFLFSEDLQRHLMEAPIGPIHVVLYKSSLDDSFAIDDNHTSAVRTIIELYAAGIDSKAQELGMHLWGVRQ